MKLTMNCAPLMDALNIVTRALAPRPAKQILEGVYFDATGDTITIACSDGSLCIEADIPGDIDESGNTVMPGHLFTEMIRKLPSGSVTVETGDVRAGIKCGAYRSNLTCMSAVEYPELPVVHEQAALSVPQKKLKEMISRVVFSIATDEVRQLLTGCLLEVTADEMRVIALDGFRMAIQRTSGSFAIPDGRDKLRVVVPGKVMNELSKILPDSEDDCVLLIDGGKLQVRFGNIRLSCVLLSGEYIDYNRILPGSFSASAKVKRAELNNAIDRASLMAREGKNNLVRLNFEADQLIITSNAEMGDVREEIDAQLDGSPIEIAFNAKYIVDAIRSISEDEICMKFNSSVSPCVIVPTEGDEYLYLILPIRVFQ